MEGATYFYQEMQSEGGTFNASNATISALRQKHTSVIHWGVFAHFGI
jgi:hypothetical protein